MPQSTTDLPASSADSASVPEEPTDQLEGTEPEGEDYNAPEVGDEGYAAPDAAQDAPAEPEAPVERKTYTPAQGLADLPSDQAMVDLLGEEGAKQAEARIAQIAERTWQRLEQEKNAFHSSLRQKGWSQEAIEEYGPETMAVANQFDASIRSNPHAPELALSAAIVNRVAQGADFADELERVARMIRKTGGAPSQAVAPPAARQAAPAPPQVRASQVTVRSDRPAAATVQPAARPTTRREEAIQFLVKSGFTREQAVEATKAGQH